MMIYFILYTLDLYGTFINVVIFITVLSVLAFFRGECNGYVVCLLIALSIILPAKNTMYKMVAVYTAKHFALELQNNELGQKAYKLLNIELDEMLKEETKDERN